MLNRYDPDPAPEAGPVHDVVMLGWCCGVSHEVKEP